MQNNVKCELCGKYFKCITHKHLKKHHNISSIKQYKLLYPDAKIISDDVIKKLSTNNLEYWISKHGEQLGNIKYKEYVNFLGEKNSFEYKHNTYGWTKDEFDAYNKSRAVTEENLIKRHGEKGKEIFNNYREKQKTAGISLEYFQRKYGIDDGKKYFVDLNKKKAHTLENYIRIHGDKEIALAKLNDFYTTKLAPLGISKLQRQFLNSLYEKLPTEYKHHSYFFRTGREYCKWVEELRKPVFYDFVLNDPYKMVVEINGDYWHCNPSKYDKMYYHTIVKKYAHEIWKYDEIKKNEMIKRGFEYYTVWECDCNSNFDGEVDGVLKWILKNQK